MPIITYTQDDIALEPGYHIQLNQKEASIIYEYYKNHHISYENQELISIMQAISKFANQNELSK